LAGYRTFYAVAVVNIVAGQKKSHALEQAFSLPVANFGDQIMKGIREHKCPQRQRILPAHSTNIRCLTGSNEPTLEIPNLAKPNQDIEFKGVLNGNC
jgi:hypothetical protein